MNNAPFLPSTYTWILIAGLYTSALGGTDGNRLAHLHREDPYYPSHESARLVTPQWVGEAGVKCVIVPGIDDLRDNAPHLDELLRPMIERLKRIDGRAPITHFAVRCEPNDPLVGRWLEEGLSIDAHTWTHPCPLFSMGDLELIREDYDLSMDQKFRIPGNPPVGMRLTCIDIWNTVTPRFYTEVFNRVSEAGNFLQLSSSVTVTFSDAGKSLPKELVFDDADRPRFTKYFNQGMTIFGRPNYYYGNYVLNHPYPYTVAKLAWELPTLFSDHAGAEYWEKYGNRNLEDWLAAMEIGVLKEGAFSLCFHAYGRTKSEELVRFVDVAQAKFGNAVKFLTVREVVERLNEHLLLGQPLRDPATGQDNGVRLVDVNDDGFVDVLIGNERMQRMRVWDPASQGWNHSHLPVRLVRVDGAGNRRDAGVRFGVLGENQTVMIVAGDGQRGGWRFESGRWVADPTLVEVPGDALETVRDGADRGVRLRDVDSDGDCELIVANADASAVYTRSEDDTRWIRASYTLPRSVVMRDRAGRDAGLRFVDVNRDGRDDLVLSNDDRYALYLYVDRQHGWGNTVFAEERDATHDFLPRIVREGTNNGSWFADDRMWVANEFTAELPNHARIISFDDMLDRGRLAAGPLTLSGWHVVGPFPNDDQDALGTVFEPERDPGRIDQTRTYRGIDDREMRWQSVSGSDIGGIRGFDLQRFVQDRGFRTNDLVVYLATQLESPVAQDAVMLLGSEDGVRVYINGELIHENQARRPARLGDDRLRLRLRAGINLLLVKLEQIGAGGALVAEVRSEQPIDIVAFDE